MTGSVVMVGPASPRALADRLSGADEGRAREVRGLGGTPVNNLTRALLDAGISVELVTLAPEASGMVVFEGPNLRILAGHYRKRPRDRARDLFWVERRQVASLLAETSAPIVHAHWTYEFALGSLADSSRPTIVSARDAPLTVLRYMPDRYRLARAALAVLTRVRVSALAANSPYLAGAWRRQMLYRRMIQVIPNVVPVPAAGSTRTWGDGPTVLAVADAGPRKNVASLLRALVRIVDRHPKVRCRLVGDGLTEGSGLAALAERLGVRRRVEFVGFVDGERLAAEFARATVFVHPSLEESFGMSVAEAMSHGLPVVAGAGAGAMPWLLDDGRAGVLVDVRDPAAIAASVCELLDSPDLRAAVSSEATRRVQAEFSPAVVAERSLRVYEDLEEGRL